MTRCDKCRKLRALVSDLLALMPRAPGSDAAWQVLKARADALAGCGNPDEDDDGEVGRESKGEYCTALKNENEALRDAIEALHECVDGTGRRSDADVAELMNGAMRIPRANDKAHFSEVSDSERRIK